MKYRVEKNLLTDDAEAKLTAEIRELAGPAEEVRRSRPADAYWQNLIMKINGRIDDATSGKAISIAWAARVAIPGVVLIISFLIGLHYYVPETQRAEPSVADVVFGLPPAVIDSILVDPSRVDPALSVEDVATDVFVFSREQIAEYLIDNGNSREAVDGISEGEASTLLAVLASGHK